MERSLEGERSTGGGRAEGDSLGEAAAGDLPRHQHAAKIDQRIMVELGQVGSETGKR